MSRATIVGTGITSFGRFPDRTVRDLAHAAALEALHDASVRADEVDRVFFSNAVDGLLTGQEMIRGQVALSDIGLHHTPITNVENACASGSSAVQLATMAVESGRADIVLVVGAEKLTHADKARSFGALGAGIDLERRDALERDLYGEDGPDAGERSFFMDVYADMAKRYMERSNATVEDFADVAVKSHDHALLNPQAQFHVAVTREEVLASRHISGVLTLMMCSPIGDGAAAVVVMSDKVARVRGLDTVTIEASELTSGVGDAASDPVEKAALAAYEAAGIGPSEVDVVEVHDAAAPAELSIYEELHLCGPGEGASLLASGATRLGGRVPVNTSGGLISRGHPVGATGVAQLVELTNQLRGRCGDRQVEGARIALAENSGGYLGPHPAATAVTLLSRR